MKLEKQVVSLELAKKLKELGVKQESYFNWLVASDGARLMKNPVLDTYKYFDQFSAFTVAELGEMLPTKIHQDKKQYTLLIDRDATMELWRVVYLTGWVGDNFLHEIFSTTEADARAKMLIYLIENKLI